MKNLALFFFPMPYRWQPTIVRFLKSLFVNERFSRHNIFQVTDNEILDLFGMTLGLLELAMRR